VATEMDLHDPTTRAQEFASAVPEGCAIATMGITPILADGGLARARMVVTEKHLNQVGVVQGGVYALFADATAGWAAMSLLPKNKTFVTLEMRVNLLRAVRPGATLLAESTPIHRGGATLVFGVRVWDEGGTSERLSAYFVCTQMVVDQG